MKECQVCHQRTLMIYKFGGKRYAACGSCDPKTFKLFEAGIVIGVVSREEQ
jgi:hypothetical protein